jgi:hypothetical protein
MLKLRKGSLDWALAHVLRHGDTDVLPVPFEFKAIEHDWVNVRDHLLAQDVLDWLVRPQRSLLSPKMRYAFRSVTQLDPLDFLIFAALVREIAVDIEERRVALDKKVVFSYRVDIGSDGQLFGSDVGYEQWRARARHWLRKSSQFTHVGLADIADFYPRIYHHRLENAVNACTTKTNHVKAIMRLLSGWNETETFGIPVGNQPSRLLAEAALIDVDEALLATGATFIRYNDDFRIFGSSQADVYRTLAFLADVLYRNHGLTLQPQKTFVTTADDFSERFLKTPEQRESDSLGEKFEQLADDLGLANEYEDIDYDDLTPEQQQLVDSLNLTGLFDEELASGDPDLVNIRFVLGRLAQLGDPALADRAIDNIETLYPVFPEIINYLGKLRGLDAGEYSRIGSKLLDALSGSMVSELEYHRMWGLHLFSESTEWNNAERFFKMLGEARDNVTRRKLILAMGRAHQTTWFQMQWRNLFNEPPWPRRALIAAASCLAVDARKHWYKSIEPRLDPLELAVMKWAKANPF